MSELPLCLLGIEPNLLEMRFLEFGYPSYLFRQVMQWIYAKNTLDFQSMSNISKENRQKLSDQFWILPFLKNESIVSQDALAIKNLSTLQDGFVVESVVLKEKKGYTLCISSQVGCPVDCKFCLTGLNGFKRNLSSEEILGQFLLARSQGYCVDHVVFMGMGEPLLNFDNVFLAKTCLNADWGFALGRRKITLSTVGYLPGIKRLIKKNIIVNLAFSVGSTDPVKRKKIMPITERYSFSEVVEALKEYQGLHNRKLTLEYTLLSGENDSDNDILGLVELSKYLSAKVNLINLNPHKKILYKPVSSKRLLEIRDYLSKRHVPTTIRFRKGQDILGACGQLGQSDKN